MRTLSLLMLLCIVLTTISYAQAPELPAYVPEEGLIGFWTFNNSAEDSSPNQCYTENFGISFDSTRLYQSNQVGVFDQGDSCNQYLKIHIDDSLITNNLTLSFWVKQIPVELCPASRLMAWGGLNPLGFQIIPNHPSLGAFALQHFLPDGGALLNTATVDPEFDFYEWSHFTYTLSDSIAKIYTNGVYRDSYTSNHPNVPVIEQTIRLGKLFEGSDETWRGMIDDFGLWNRVLTPSEIYDLYNIEIPTSTKVTPSSTSFKLYPNPSNGILNIEIMDTEAVQHIQISNMLGQELIRQAPNSTNTSLDLSNVKAGLYLVQLLDKEGSVLGMEKVIVK